MKFKIPSSLQNWISFIGMTVVIICLIVMMTLFFLTTFIGYGGLYLGLVIYILLPAVMMAGFFLVFLGMIVKTRKLKKHKEMKTTAWPRIDLNLSGQRRTFFVASFAIVLFLILSALGSYEAFHFTESSQFCGQLCHKVMKPEYTAYQFSPHARVSCVECHVGPGAGWYVRSKLSGLHQVYATLTNTYPIPIPTPIENLRPARETCEQCHWPEHFYAHKIQFETYYLADEENSEWNIRLVMKVGPEHPAMGLKEGIHWHINPDVRIEYFASDEKREEMLWVRYTDIKKQEVKLYRDDGRDLNQEEMAEVRTMDCIDCHNRPSHDYRAPSQFVNSALTSGSIASSLPEIKSLAMDLCGREYSTTDEGLETINKEIHEFYAEKYPEIQAQKRHQIKNAVKELQIQFLQNIFPEMKVRWSTHLNHIGHLNDNGCFRCHFGSLASENDAVIRRDCNLCHIITAQGKPGNLQLGNIREPLDFKHPVDIGEAWKESLCSECHEGSGF